MKLQEYMVGVTKAAAEEAFRYAKAVPEDKLDWSPLDAGRSVLNQCREMAMCPTWAYDIISKPGPLEWNEEAGEAMKAEQESWKSIADCEAELNRRLDILFELFSTMPDERLEESKWLPYDGGRDFKMPEMMDYPRWNFNYHLGQIGYIQTLLGDKEMH